MPEKAEFNQDTKLSQINKDLDIWYFLVLNWLSILEFRCQKKVVQVVQIWGWGGEVINPKEQLFFSQENVV